MSKTVILPYDPTWRALEWAKANCKSYITNQGVDVKSLADLSNGYTIGKIEYFFGDERDATLFRLRFA